MRCEDIIGIFPGAVREIFREMDLEPAYLQEIRIRAERPMLAVCGNREYRSRRDVSAVQVGKVLSCLGSYSLYAYEAEIRQGFLTLPGGHRVGIAGRTVLEQGVIRTMTEISSSNIRFSRQVKGCADGLMPSLWAGEELCHTLLVSAPGRGKTTLLRDCIRQISDGCGQHGGMTVGVVDERSEIAGICRGTPGNDLGIRTDVLDGCPKAEGMMLLIRSMAPRVLAVDEIGGFEDLKALEAALNCGCTMLATVHGNSMEELHRKPCLGEMMEKKIFERYVFLARTGMPGQVQMVTDEDGQIIWRADG